MAGYGKQMLVRNAFLWLMSVIYLFAFSSLYVQIPGKSTNLSHCCVAFLETKLINNSVYSHFDEKKGLYGQNGVLPAKLALREGEIFSYIAVSFVNCTFYSEARN